MGYTSDWGKAEITNERFCCPECKGKEIECRDWESSCGGYDDTHYRCKKCGKEWWVEGIDS